MFASVLAGCAHNPIPAGYVGDKARIDDSFVAYGETKANFFFVEEVDGHSVTNALNAIRYSNYGGGPQMTPVAEGRDVPAQQLRLRIRGRTAYAAPIMELASDVFDLSGEITATLQPNKRYTVQGVLGKDYSAVWIESATSDQAVLGDIIVVKDVAGTRTVAAAGEIARARAHRAKSSSATILVSQDVTAAAPQGTSRVVFFNESNSWLYDDSAAVQISIDGRELPHIKRGEYAQVFLAPGAHALNMKHWDMFLFNDDYSLEVPAGELFVKVFNKITATQYEIVKTLPADFSKYKQLQKR